MNDAKYINSRHLLWKNFLFSKNKVIIAERNIPFSNFFLVLLKRRLRCVDIKFSRHFLQFSFPTGLRFFFWFVKGKISFFILKKLRPFDFLVAFQCTVVRQHSGKNSSSSHTFFQPMKSQHYILIADLLTCDWLKIL